MREQNRRHGDLLFGLEQRCPFITTGRSGATAFVSGRRNQVLVSSVRSACMLTNALSSLLVYKTPLTRHGNCRYLGSNQT